MDKMILALAPAFAAGFAIQQLLEILDHLIEKIIGSADKKLVLGIVSLIVGIALAWGGGLKVLQPLGVMNADLIDLFVTGLIISGGTQGINAIIKFLGYAKEDKKAEAASKKADASAKAMAQVDRT